MIIFLKIEFSTEEKGPGNDNLPAAFEGSGISNFVSSTLNFCRRFQDFKKYEGFFRISKKGRSWLKNLNEKCN